MEQSRARLLTAGLVLSLAVTACNILGPPPAPDLRASPSSVTLSAVIGSFQRQNVVISNAGDLGTDVRLTLSSPELSVEPEAVFIPAKGSRTVEVTGRCGLDEGTFDGTLVVDPEEDAPSLSVAVSLDCTAVSSEFDIEVVFLDGSAPTAEQQAVFELAAARWSQVIVGDLPDVTSDVDANSCGTAHPAFQDLEVDDLVILAMVTPIDGEGGVLGQAGPCELRGSSFLPWFGIMKFDSADMAAMEEDGSLFSVILHEMGHVLGIGTLWEVWATSGMNVIILQDLVTPEGQLCEREDPGADYRFVGSEANDQHALLGGDGALRVESHGGPGTACGHWDEDTYAHELMTGWADAGVSPLSTFTIGSLADMGYVVTYVGADPYTVPEPGSLRAQGRGFQIVEELFTPRLPKP